MYVFRYGKFYEYNEAYGDISWNYEQLLIASSFFASCIYKNIDEKLAYSLSYIYVSKPEIKYPEIYEIQIKKILNSA